MSTEFWQDAYIFENADGTFTCFNPDKVDGCSFYEGAVDSLDYGVRCCTIERGREIVSGFVEQESVQVKTIRVVGGETKYVLC